MELNMFWAIALPIGSIAFSALGAFVVAIYHFYDVRKADTIQKVQLTEKERLKQEQQELARHKQRYQDAGQRVVSSVNSNNNSPRLGENLTILFSRMTQLNIALNMDMGGCTENDR